jgi:hypothetical protein
MYNLLTVLHLHFGFIIKIIAVLLIKHDKLSVMRYFKMQFIW